MERGEDAEAVCPDDLALAPAGECRTDEVEMRGEAQEHQPVNLVRHGIQLVLRQGFLLSMVAAAVPHGRLELADEPRNS